MSENYLDDAIIRAINSRYERFKDAKGNPPKILGLLKEIMIEPGVFIAFEKYRRDSTFYDKAVEEAIKFNPLKKDEEEIKCLI